MLWGLLAMLLLPLGADLWVGTGAKLARSPEDLAPAEFGLVLGTAPRVRGGRKNLFFERRMDAAAALLASGKVQRLILSGDAHRDGYDEPAAMQAGLVERGVPEDRLLLDPFGLDTLHSLRNARDATGAQSVVIVTQGFHAARAQYLARHVRLPTQALAAQDPAAGAARLKVRLREIGARCKALAQVLLQRID